MYTVAPICGTSAFHLSMTDERIYKNSNTNALHKPEKTQLSLHVILTCLHFGLFCYVLFAGDVLATVTVYRTRVRLTFAQDAVHSAFGLGVPEQVAVGEFSMTLALAVQFVWTSLFHGIQAYGTWCRMQNRRTALVKAVHPVNTLRWIEYAFSATLVAVVVALLSGVQSVEQLSLIATLVAITMPFGLWTEVEVQFTEGNAKGANGAARSFLPTARLPLLLGCVPQAAAWTVIFASFADFASNESPHGGKMPDWVYAIVIGEVLLYLAFVILPILRVLQKNGKPLITTDDAELGYAILSFLSKAFIGVIYTWQANQLTSFAAALQNVTLYTVS